MAVHSGALHEFRVQQTLPAGNECYIAFIDIRNMERDSIHGFIQVQYTAIGSYTTGRSRCATPKR
jgi:hypothetical protein